MKPYPRAEELLAPFLQVAMPRAVGSPAFLEGQFRGHHTQLFWTP